MITITEKLFVRLEGENQLSGITKNRIYQVIGWETENRKSKDGNDTVFLFSSAVFCFHETIINDLLASPGQYSLINKEDQMKRYMAYQSCRPQGQSGWYVYFKDGCVIRFDTETEARWYSAMMALKNTKTIYRGHS